MLSRNLGQSGISVSAIGLGCMGLSEFYGEPTQEPEAINLLHRAVDLGITHFDTAETYGQGRNEQLLGRAFAGRWHQIRALDAAKRSPSADALLQGVEMVRRQFLGKLEGLGVKPIESGDARFDPTLHEAVSTVPASSPEQDGMVVGIIRRGYRIGDDVLRPAAVAVAKA